MWQGYAFLLVDLKHVPKEAYELAHTKGIAERHRNYPFWLYIKAKKKKVIYCRLQMHCSVSLIRHQTLVKSILTWMVNTKKKKNICLGIKLV